MVVEPMDEAFDVGEVVQKKVSVTTVGSTFVVVVEFPDVVMPLMSEEELRVLVNVPVVLMVGYGVVVSVTLVPTGSLIEVEELMLEYVVYMALVEVEVGPVLNGPPVERVAVLVALVDPYVKVELVKGGEDVGGLPLAPVLKGSNMLLLLPVPVVLGPLVPVEMGPTVTVELKLNADELLEELTGGKVKG
ncbi:MAG: hypothetical protein Q9213_004425 [Squamulea squamosa]